MFVWDTNTYLPVDVLHEFEDVLIMWNTSDTHPHCLIMPSVEH
jgi:hypothetical protein